MTPVTANSVADFFLCFCREHGDVVTHLKLQKLLYYAQAWHLALKKKPLFDEPIEAWVHGPVVRSVYRRFRECHGDPISLKSAKPELGPAVEKHLTEVFSAYGRYSAWDLERMTHQEEPWQKARKGLNPDEEGKSEIARQHMTDFYRALAASK